MGSGTKQNSRIWYPQHKLKVKTVWTGPYKLFLCMKNKTIEKMKRQTTERKKIFASYTSKHSLENSWNSVVKMQTLHEENIHGLKDVHVENYHMKRYTLLLKRKFIFNS